MFRISWAACGQVAAITNQSSQFLSQASYTCIAPRDMLMTTTREWFPSWRASRVITVTAAVVASSLPASWFLSPGAVCRQVAPSVPSRAPLRRLRALTRKRVHSTVSAPAATASSAAARRSRRAAAIAALSIANAREAAASSASAPPSRTRREVARSTASVLGEAVSSEAARRFHRARPDAPVLFSRVEVY